MSNRIDDERRINTIRFLAVDTVENAKSGHPGTPLGAAAAAYTLWSRHLTFDPADPHWSNRDRFILSSGHASALLYALLHLFGYDVTIDDLKHFRQLGSRAPGHPEFRHTDGVEATTGPLGQGFANAVGLAIAQAHISAVYGNGGQVFDHHTYVMAGDGDMMEGVASEAASIAGHLKLGKLICLYDDNKISLAAPTSVTFTEDVGLRFEAYGWHVTHIDEEHANDVDTIDAAIAAARAEASRPSIVIIHSVIGFGSPRAGTFASHGEPLGPENAAQTKATLGWPAEPAFLVPDDVARYFNDRRAAGTAAHHAWHEAYADWKRANAVLASQFERTRSRMLPPDLPWPAFTAESGALATRDAGAMVMNAVAGALPEIVGGSADLDPSTKTYLKGTGDFQPGTYGGRNIHYGVREHAMGAISNGIALAGGLLPFSATFLSFLDYCKPALRLAALNRLRCIYVFTHDSVFLGEDGPTHQPIEQLAMLRAIPNVIDLRPADALEVLAAWRYAIESDYGPSVIVLTRQKLPFLGERVANVARGAYILVDTARLPDVILIASGSEVALARDAAIILEGEGTKTRVVSIPSFHLFDRQDDAYRESVLPSSVRARVSIEAASTFGWKKYVGDTGIAYGIDHFGTSAPGPDIAKHYGFTPRHIADLASSLLSRI